MVPGLPAVAVSGNALVFDGVGAVSEEAAGPTFFPVTYSGDMKGIVSTT